MRKIDRIKILMKKAVKKIMFQNPNSLYGKQELRELVERMDQGNFAFTPAEEQKMIKQWHFCVSECPLPTKVKSIYYGNTDAFRMNSLEVADVGFKLPYGIAFEEAQRKEYQGLIDFAIKNHIDFENKMVLDAGCGFGGLLACVHKNFPSARCMGIECVPSAKELLAKSRPWIQSFTANMEADTATFQKQFPHKADVIFCTAVLEHVHRPAIALRNLLSIKAKGGVLILSVPNGRMDQAAQHIHFWSPESWNLFIKDTAIGYRVDFPKANPDNSGSSIGYDLSAIIRDL